jgi:hypothetical protein
MTAACARAEGEESGGFAPVPSMSMDFDLGSEADLSPSHRTGSSLGFGSLPSGVDDEEAGGQGIALVVDAEVGLCAGVQGLGFMQDTPCLPHIPAAGMQGCMHACVHACTGHDRTVGCWAAEEDLFWVVRAGDVVPHDGRAVAGAQAPLRHALRG